MPADDGWPEVDRGERDCPGGKGCADLGSGGREGSPTWRFPYSSVRDCVELGGLRKESPGFLFLTGLPGSWYGGTKDLKLMPGTLRSSPHMLTDVVGRALGGRIGDARDARDAK